MLQKIKKILVFLLVLPLFSLGFSDVYGIQVHCSDSSLNNVPVKIYIADVSEPNPQEKFLDQITLYNGTNGYNWRDNSWSGNKNLKIRIEIPNVANSIYGSSEWYDVSYSKQTFSKADTILFVAAANSLATVYSDVYFQIPPAKNLSGKVVNTSHTGLQNITVNIFETDSFHWVAETKTDAVGDYSFAGLYGNYYIKVGDNSAYFPMFATTVNNGGSYDAVTVNVSGTNVSLSNTILQTAGTVSGTIANGSGAEVTAFLADGISSDIYKYVNKTTAGTGGVYSLSLPVGVDVVIKADKSGYMETFYNNVYGGDDATPVSANRSGVNFSLQTSSAISGTVYVGGAQVKIFSKANPDLYISGINAGTDGSFSVVVPNGGQYIVCAVSNNYFETYYAGVGNGTYDRAYAATVNPGANNVSFTLPRAVTISGSVKDNAGLNLGNISIKAFVAGLDLQTGGGYIKEVTSNSSGVFAIAVPSDNRGIWLQASTENTLLGYPTGTWYPNKRSTADTVVLYGATTNAQFVLDKYWKITGNIALGNGVNPAGTKIEAFIPSWNWLAETTANASGYYEMTGTGNYANVFLRFSTGNYVTVTTNTKAINAGNIYNYGAVTLNLGGIISVRILGGSGEPVTINIESPSGDYFTEIKATANGIYYNTPALPAGNWVLRAFCSGYLIDPVAVEVIAGQTKQVSITLTQSKVIAGQITEYGNVSNKLAGVKVAAFSNESYVTESITNSNGEYRLTVSAGGRYYIQASTQNYFTQWYDSAFGYGDRVSVNTDDVSRNFTLYKTGKISGDVRKGTVPQGLVTVSAFIKGSNYIYVNAVTTNASGVFDLPIPIGPQLILQISSANIGYPYGAWHAAGGAEETSANAVVFTGSASGVQIRLIQRWQISGLVRSSADNSLLSGVSVKLCDALVTSTVYAETTTLSDGYYALVSANPLNNVVLIFAKNDHETLVTPAVPFSINTTADLRFDPVLIYIAPPIEPIPPGKKMIDTIMSGPNPANLDDGPVHIGFILDGNYRVRVRIYTIGGELVYQDDRRFPAGYGEFVWNGNNLYRQRVPNGVYLGYVEIDTGSKKINKVLKIAILR